VARKAVNDFKKVATSKQQVADIMLFYVEQGSRFTNEYGDTLAPTLELIRTDQDGRRNPVLSDNHLFVRRADVLDEGAQLHLGLGKGECFHSDSSGYWST
jgi:hypothetical protein